MDSGYDQVPLDGGRIRFTIRPASPPRLPVRWMGLPVLAAVAVLLAPIGGSDAGPFVLRATLGAVAAMILSRQLGRWHRRRIERQRAPGGSFVVSPGRIELEDAVIERHEAFRLVVRNPESASGEAGVSYRLCAETNGRSTLLAGGMTATIARGLLIDVSRVLGRN